MSQPMIFWKNKKNFEDFDGKTTHLDLILVVMIHLLLLLAHFGSPGALFSANAWAEAGPSNLV